MPGARTGQSVAASGPHDDHSCKEVLQRLPHLVRLPAMTNDVQRSGSALGSRHKTTLSKIEAHPASHNIKWVDVISLLSAVGDVTERHDGRFLVIVGGEREILDPPRNKTIDTQTVVDVRRMIKGWETHSANAETAGEVPPEQDAVLALDFHRARIFDIARASDAGESVVAADPWGLNRHLHHKYYFEHGHYDLDEIDTFKMFEAIRADLAPYRRVVIAGHGSGKANAADSFVKWLHAHHRYDEAKLVGTVRCDVDDITDRQLLRWAEEYFGKDEPTRDYPDSRRGETE
jgi:hypothetical protein